VSSYGADQQGTYALVFNRQEERGKGISDKIKKAVVLCITNKNSPVALAKTNSTAPLSGKVF
jgi:hypothetical protein